MEVPIFQAIDTTENWRRSDTVLGSSELAIEIYTLPDGKKVKYLLVGDGKIVRPDVERLRAKPDFIASLPDYIAQVVDAETQALQRGNDALAQALSAEEQARQQADRDLQEAINLLVPGEQGNFADWLASKAPVHNPAFTGVVKIPAKADAARNEETLIATEAQVYHEEQERRQAVNAVNAAVKELSDHKADKVTAAAAGNFASLNAQGNLADSGKKPDSFQAKIITASCTTAAATAAKTVTITGYALTAGDILAITYTNGNTAAATININGAGSKAVSLGGGDPTGVSGSGAHYIAAGRTALYFYNGTYMCLLGSQNITSYAEMSGQTLGLVRLNGNYTFTGVINVPTPAMPAG